MNNVNTNKTLRLCTFSRVMKEKGIEDAILAVKRINTELEKVIFSLDIYGQIDGGQETWFRKVMQTAPEYVCYSGIVPYNQSTQVLKDYYALLFPTYYDGEGFAGTLIDAMAAGIPVIASDWKYNADIVKDHCTGYLFQTGNMQEFEDKLLSLYQNSSFWNHSKREILKSAYSYLPERVIGVLIEQLTVE